MIREIKKSRKGYGKNWDEMTDEMKKKIDARSVELFGKDNTMHHKEIMRKYK